MMYVRTKATSISRYAIPWSIDVPEWKRKKGQMWRETENLQIKRKCEQTITSRRRSRSHGLRLCERKENAGEHGEDGGNPKQGHHFYIRYAAEGEWID